ncbi:DUF4062 domain-containing protein [Pelotomaculum propionicicum]|uniref:DUF4062 domain-containing protein n=1 Tax=Pelotomaculum propionicicum TaxID=258475 RepID=UPI003B7B843D
MAEKKYQVFISSTYSDLIEERRKILNILLMADCIPSGMEAFVATDDEQFEVIKRVIDLCDYYILIIGKRYGSVNPKTGFSYTEMEYEYAREKGIPVLVFAIDDSAVLPEEKVDQDTGKIEKLGLFREKALTNRLASIWKTNDELTGQLAIAIMRAKSEISRPGWQRAVDYDEASLRREVMDLQTQKNDLESKLLNANNVIASLTTQNNVAFDDCEIRIDYYYYDRNFMQNRSKSTTLPQIFSVIATEMMDVLITESGISTAIKNQIFKGSDFYFTDHQFLKRIMNQFKALGLVYSTWSNEKSTLFWGLTIKGQKVRDDMILIRNKGKG